MLPFFKALSPGYRRRLAPFRVPEACEITSLGEITSPAEVTLERGPAWRGYQVDRYLFESPVECTDECNHPVRGLLITDHPEAPWVVVIPGFATGAWPPYSYSLFQELHGRALLERSVNVALLDPPFHLSRTLPGHRSGEGFFSPDLHRTQSAMRQAAADAIALLRWLQKRHQRPVGLWGTSMGGCIAGLVTTQVEDLAGVVLMEPLDNPGDALAWLPGSREIRDLIRQQGITPEEIPGLLRDVAPSAYPPAVPLERILFITPAWDRVVPARFQDAWWETWGRPPRIVERMGHVALAKDRNITASAAGFLARRLKETHH